MIMKNTPKEIDQYTLDGVLLKSWPSILAAANSTGILHSSISRAARGFMRRILDDRYKTRRTIKNVNSAGGYVWRYKGFAFEQPYPVPLLNPGKSKRKVETVGPEGKCEHNSQTEASDYLIKYYQLPMKNKLPVSDILKRCKGRYRHHQLIRL